MYRLIFKSLLPLLVLCSNFAYAEDQVEPSWQVPLKPENPPEEIKKQVEVVENFQIPTDDDSSKYPVSVLSFFYTPGSGAFVQKFKSSGDQMTFNTGSGRSYRGLFEYNFNYHYAIGALFSSYTFNTDEKKFSFITMRASSNPMNSLGAFMRWSTHLTSLKKKLSFDFLFTKETLPLIDFSPDDDTLLQVYSFKPTFWNLALSYQSPVNSFLDLNTFFQYGAPIDNPSMNGLKLTSAHHIAFGAAVSASIMESWRLQLGFENTSYLAEAKNGEAINQSLMTSLIFKVGLSYELPQLLPDKPKMPANLDNGEYLQGI